MGFQGDRIEFILVSAYLLAPFQARILQKAVFQVMEMGKVVLAFSKSEAIPMFDASVMRTHVFLEKHGNFRAGTS